MCHGDMVCHDLPTSVFDWVTKLRLEVTADYGWSDKMPCSCGASNCTGVIGQRKRESKRSNGQEPHVQPKKARTVKVSIAEHAGGGHSQGKKGATKKSRSTAAGGQRDRLSHMDWQSQRKTEVHVERIGMCEGYDGRVFD